MEMMSIKKLRNNIEKIDSAIIKKLAEREKLVKKIGQLKACEGKPIVDLTREKKLLRFYENLSETYHLSFPYIKRLFKIIIDQSRKSQKS